MSDAKNKTSQEKIPELRMGAEKKHTSGRTTPSFKTRYIRHCGGYGGFHEKLGRSAFIISETETKRLVAKKHGRNKACFCGSERKLKKCCLIG
jgi:uncharacterized protein YchJ